MIGVTSFLMLIKNFLNIELKIRCYIVMIFLFLHLLIIGVTIQLYTNQINQKYIRESETELSNYIRIGNTNIRKYLDEDYEFTTNDFNAINDFILQ